MTPIVLTFLVNVVGSFFKNYVFPRWGKLGVQVIVFLAALIAATYYAYVQDIPTIAHIVQVAAGIFAAAITLYEVLLSYFPFFKSTDVK